jgi:hypothetical protein
MVAGDLLQKWDMDRGHPKLIGWIPVRIRRSKIPPCNHMRGVSPRVHGDLHYVYQNPQLFDYRALKKTQWLISNLPKMKIVLHSEFEPFISY